MFKNPNIHVHCQVSYHGIAIQLVKFPSSTLSPSHTAGLSFLGYIVPLRCFEHIINIYNRLVGAMTSGNINISHSNAISRKLVFTDICNGVNLIFNFVNDFLTFNFRWFGVVHLH